MSSTATTRRLFAAWRGSRALLDLAVAAVVFGVSLVLLSHGGAAPNHAGSHQADVTGVVLAACSAVPLVAWRRAPLGVFALTAAVGVLQASLGRPVISLLLGPAVALYLLAAYRDRETPWTVRSATVVIGLFVAYLGAMAAAERTIPEVRLTLTALSWAVAWFAGERTRLRRAHVADLRQRALHAERDTERERLLAIAEERARIARDLHDSAGHAISLIGIRAGAARLRRDRDQGRTLQALQVIEDLARHTVEEIDQIVGTLRQGAPANGDVEAPPGLASLDTLIAHHTAAGLRVSLDTVGTPRPLGAAADQAAYRILQQALTNAARHGAGSAQVELTFAGTAAELTVTNPVHHGRTPRPGGGHGLIGMRERATLLGGSLDTERADGSFRVRASIPYGGHRA